MPWLPPALPQGLTAEPSDHPDDIHRGGREELLEVRARSAKVPTPAQIEAARALRESTLDPCPQRILRSELRCLLALPGGLECLMVDLWADRQLAWGSSRRGTGEAGGACATRGPVEPDANDRVA